LKIEKQKSKVHIPVLLNETLEFLALKPGHNCIDMTLGLGGHARAILDATSPSGRLLGLDRDCKSIKIASNNLEEYGDRICFEKTSFSNSLEAAEKNNFNQVDAVLFDLGVSSWQLDNQDRGFSFSEDGPLDMRMDSAAEITAADIINSFNERELAYIIYKYGDERLSRQISKEICEKRKVSKINTTSELAKLVSGVYFRKGWKRSRVHPATKTFQALRIVVNNEFYELEKGLEDGFELLKPGGRMVVISFHSGEDRIVKLFFRMLSREKKEAQLLTKKPVVASFEERKENPRARSAKLRALTKL